jgi:hypothetical protein
VGTNVAGVTVSSSPPPPQPIGLDPMPAKPVLCSFRNLRRSGACGRLRFFGHGVSKKSKGKLGTLVVAAEPKIVSRNSQRKRVLNNVLVLSVVRWSSSPAGVRADL